MEGQRCKPNGATAHEIVRIGNVEAGPAAVPGRALPAFFSVPDLAERWCCSRASVYNRIRGYEVLDFAAKGHKGSKLVPLRVVLEIERGHMKILR
jgi:hypothetical protein